MAYRRPRVLWVSESPRLHTGFGRVADELIKRLAATDKYELGVLGWGIDPLKAGPEEDNSYRVYRPSTKPWDRDHMDVVIGDFAPDILITFGPVGAFRAVPHLRFRNLVAWMAYLAAEGGPLSEKHREIVRNIDVPIAPSVWCRDLVNACGPQRETAVIPQGVCAKTFRPLPERERLRAANGLGDRFVVGCVARNQFRKQIPVLIKAFARFARSHPEATLYLHMDPDDSGWPLTELVDRYGVSERTAFTRGLSGVLGVSLEALNQIYNLFDVMVLPTMGEAFGLPLVEAMAAGIPVVATDCSAVSELVGDRGELIKVKETVTMPWDNAEYSLADVDDLVGKLERLHASADLRRCYAERGLSFAREKSWGQCAQSWEELIDSFAPALVSAAAAREGARLRIPRPRSRVALVGPWNIACGVAEEMRILHDGALRPMLVFSELDSPGEYLGDDEGVIRCYRRTDSDYDRLLQELLEHEVDVVHVQFNHGLFNAEALARLLWRLRREGVRTVLTLHCTEVDLTRLVSAADVTIVTTEEARRRLVGRGADPKRLRVIPLPVRDLSASVKTGKMAATLMSTSFQPTIVTTGFCFPHKGLADLIETTAQLRRDFPRVGLVALSPVYPGSQDSARYFAQCQRLAKDLELTDQVVLVDSFRRMDMVAEVVNAADIVVFPYRHGAGQDSSGALRMAMGANAPAVVTDVELFSDLPREAAARAAPSDPKSLAAAIRAVLRDSDLRQRLLENKRLVNASIDEPTVVERHWCEAYQAFGDVSIHLEGTVDSYFSFAQVLRNMALALDAVGCDVSVDRWSVARADHFVPPPRLQTLAARSPRSGLTVRMSYPHRPTGIRGRRRALMFPWEVTRVPEPLLAELEEGPDYVLAASTFVRDVLIQCGLSEERVRIVQHGVDAKRFSPEAPPADLAALASRGWYSRPDLDLTRAFRFLHLGHAQIRKGTDVLLAAFCEEFSGSDDVCLVVKSYDGGDISKWLKRLDLRDRDAPRIVYLYEDVSEAVLPGIYTACHCLVSPSRGEGFGLPVLEAMACGLPVIVTGWGGHMDFCGSRTNYLLECDLVPVSRFQVRVPKDAQWAEPSKKHLKALLRHVVERPEEARAVGKRAHLAAQAWTWERAGIQLLQETGMLE